MVLKQIALSQEENDVLYDLTLHEIRHAQVYGNNADIVGMLRTLLKLNEMFDQFNPPRGTLRRDDRKTKEEKEVRDENPPHKKAGRPRKGNLQDKE